ncbi:hypothetical protein [Rubellicoccus peritrichatus]|uniref:Uncharacterized protein n=1 Tax=Rubellicoccus peritrichatus TaxID=3080537 RepID=A0AAQ3L5H2_9BACT|nr:hypothetical protein [Puniceicoccus sp. CR14]WOO39794.1 hypothetical protein RZN69_14310 [Puniceicoccus sp. CR14]
MKKKGKSLWSMMSGSIALAALMKLSGCISAGSNVDPVFTGEMGRNMPEVVGINLEGQNVKIPDGLEGQDILVIVAYEREQQENVNTWIPELVELEKTNPNFRFYELPVIYKGGAAFRFWVNNGMRSGITDTPSRLRTITVYTNREAFNQFLDIPNTDQIQLLLLNHEKQIVWRSTGDYTPEKYASIKQRISQ